MRGPWQRLLGLLLGGDFALARYNPDGTLDAGFDTDGKVTTDFGGHDSAHGVAITFDGGIVAAGQSDDANIPSDFAIAFYEPDGSLDTRFTGDGKVTTDFGGGDYAHGVAVDPDGRIVAAGRSGGDFALARYEGAVSEPSFDPASLAFGGVPVGSASDLPQTVEVQNTGHAPLAIDSVALLGANAADFNVGFDGCATQTLPPGSACNVNVSFLPTSPGVRQARLDFNTNAPGSPHSVPLSGTGAVPQVSFDPPGLAFGTMPVGEASDPLSVSVENSGGASLAIDSVALLGANAADFSVGFDGCATQTLPPGSACNVNVSFLPTSPGVRQARLDFNTNAPGSPHSIVLSGTGAAAPFPPPNGDPLNLPAELVINRAEVRVGASAAQRHGGRRLIIRGALNDAAAGERVVVRFRAAGRQIVIRPVVQANGRFQVSRRLRGPQRRASAGGLIVRYAGNETLRAVRTRLRATRRAVGLRIVRAEIGAQRNHLALAGRVVPRAGRAVRIEVKFNRPDGSPAQVVGRARPNARGRFRSRLRVPPAVRNLGARISITHPGRVRLFGQRRGQNVGG